MGDWNTTQPAPEGVEPGTKAPLESGAPYEGWQMPGETNTSDGFTGEAIPPSNRKMH